MEALQKVVEVLEKPGTLPQRLAESEVQDGLRQLERILVTAVDGGSAFLDIWTKQQQEFVLVVVDAILCASSHLVADGGEKEVVEQIYGLTVQLCLQGLDSYFSGPDIRARHADEEVPQKLLSLLETAIVGRKSRDRGTSSLVSLEVVVSEIPTFDLPVNLEGEVHQGSSFGSEEAGRSSLEDSSSSKNILTLLASEELVVHNLTGRGSEGARVDVLLKPGVSIVAATRQFALVHVKCMTRLLSICQMLLTSCQKVGSEEGEKELQGKVSVVVSVVKLLVDLSKSCTGFDFEEEVVQNIVDLAATVPALLGHTYDYSSLENDYLVETGLGISLATIIDEFLQLARLVLPDYHLFLNWRTYLAASMLDLLGGAKGRHDGPLTGQVFSLICTPQVISGLVVLLQDVYAHSYASVQPLSRLEDSSVGKKAEGLPGSSTSSRSCLLRNQVFSLSEVRSKDDHLEILFPEDGHWLDNLVAAAALVHAQGLKESSVAETASSVHSEEESAVGSVDSVTVASEDDALFGDLFSESGRQSVASEGNPQTCSSAKKLDGVYNAPLQATHQVMSFLKDCIFLPDWHQPTFRVACRNLSKDHLDVFLQIHFSQSSIGKRQASIYEVVEVESHTDLLVQLHKDSFDFLQTLVVRHVLSETLETHLASQILRAGDSGLALTGDNLVVLARLLLNRSGRTREETDDPLIFMLWKNFVDALVNKAKSKLVDINMEKASAYLPSLFHMEVLFMAFHAASISGRVGLLQSLLSALKSLRGSEKQFSAGPSLAVWSILVSRLVLAIRYLALNFNNYPKWLVMHLRRNLQSQPTEERRTLPLDDRPLSSWAAVVAMRIREQHGALDQHGPTEVCSQELFDVSEFCAAGLESEGLSSLHLDLCELGQVLDDLLEIWRDKSVKSVDELLIERYVFCLSWSILQTKGPVWKPILPWDMQIPAGRPLGADFFFGLGRSLHAIIRQNCSVEVGEWRTYMLQTFRMIEERLSVGNINLHSWEFLRQGASLSLLLSMLQAGLWSCSGKPTAVSDDTDVSGVTEHGHLLAFLEQFVRDVLKDGSLRQLLKSLSAVLAWYVDALRSSVSDILKDSSQHGGVSSSTDLLFRGDLTRSNQHQLLESAGVDVEAVKILLRWDSSTTWKGDIISQLIGPEHDSGDLKDANNIFLPALLHGFPATSHPGSAAVVSSLLTLEAVLDTLEGLFQSQALAGGFSVETVGDNLIDDIFGRIMTMMVDSTFENVRSRCASLLDSLIPSQEEQARCRDVYLLRHVEDLCRSVSVNRDVDPSVKEGVIVQAVEAVNCIRIDPARSPVLDTYFLAAEKTEDMVEGSKRELTWSWGKASSLVGSGSLSPFILVLKGCSCEILNMKVLQLLVDFVSSESTTQLQFRSELQKTLLDMNVKDLAAWLELRLLGSASQKDKSPGVAISSVVRQLASDLIQMLVSRPADAQDQAMRKHLVEALLINLERAYVAYDVSSAKAYFCLLVQLAVGDALLKLLLRSVVNLVEKFSLGGAHLECLKSILEYLVVIFIACGAQKVQTPSTFAEGKHGSRNSSSRIAGAVASKTKPSVAKKASEQLPHPPINPGASAADDATSVDEDEDDAISDGELASLDRDEEDDGSNSEKVLASRVCTFTSSGSNFMEQHWYFCYTCDLTVSKGCCSVCARVCHRGHKVVYSRLSRFFCDCGAGGVRGSSCLCLKPRKYVSSTGSLPTASSNGSEPFLPLGGHPPSQSESDTDVEDDDLSNGEGMYKVSLNEQEQKEMLSFLTELDVEGQVLSLCKRLLTQLNMGQKVSVRKDEEVVLDGEKVLKAKADILQLKRAYKSGSLDMKIKAEYSNARDLKSHLVSGSIVKSLLTISSRGRLAAGEGDKVTIFDVGQLIGQPTATTVTVDKTTVKPLSKNAVRFELVQLAFNSANESYLAVAGFEDCQVFTVNPRGEVTDRLAVELSLQDSHILRVAWVPGSQVQLMVVTNKFLKIYDLSQDKIAPIHYFTVLEDTIADVCLVSIGQGQLVALVLSQQGVLYSQRVRAGADSGPCILTENIQLPDSYRAARGISLLFSAAYKLLFMSFGDGLTVVGRLDPDLTKFLQVSSLLESEQDGKTRPAAVHHWKEIFEGSGLFISLSSHRSNAAVALLLGTSELYAQPLRTAGNGSSLRVDGIAAYRPMTKERNSVLVLHDDGSLQVFSYIPSGADAASGTSPDAPKHTSNLEAEQVKKLGAALLGSRALAGATPVFPLDFFEKTSCITADIKIGGDLLRNNDSDGVKASLASDDGYLEGPSASGFKVMIYNTNPDLVMVGCRVHVGNTSASHIPSELRLFQRAVRFEEGVRSWYDVPFTNSEALLADEEFTLTVGPTFNGSSLPRIDSLEVYGRSKDDFGWKEKLDAVLDIECQGQGGTSGLAGTSSRGGKYKMTQSASLLEQVFSDSFHLLHNYYLAYRSQFPSELEEIKLEPCRKRCLPVLETVFESDSQPVLQSAARHVLGALFPAKDAYYQAKDSMRLAGVVRSYPALTARLSVGGSSSSRVIQEFCAQMHAVCKIALHRQPNLAYFLEHNGTSVVVDMVKVLWEILTWEQVDAQTINNLVIPMVDVIYGYAECLALHVTTGVPPRASVAPAVALLRQLLFSPYEAVRTSCSLAISSTLLQVPLPKQTMLAMDDGLENSRAPSLPSESGSGSSGAGQVMMDEDTSTASVQYCCDGCSTVPILRQRWHCNICPDFDLCEACYEVMDADQLPPPHTRDHSMSAIPIEMDSAVGDGSELHFSAIDELSDESLLQMATELSLQSNGSPVSCTSPLDAHEPLLQPETSDESKGLPISASRSAVNGLLLQGLVDEMQGWMKRSSGAQALPVMQLFYRLASATSGPLVESAPSCVGLDLERLIRFMLQEMDFSVSLKVNVRTNFGEVAILAFMFFNLVLRHWHAPGSDQQSRCVTALGPDAAQSSQQSSGLTAPSGDDQAAGDGASQLERACSILRQQPLINYLLNISQQLTHIYKNPSRNSESPSSSATGSGCGSLLSVRREFASGSYSPFFSDSSAKVHRGDLFGDFHRLMLDSVFRLTYSLIRPEKSEKSGDKEQITYRASAATDLKLDGWQEVLCNYINNPHTTFIRRYARRLLLHICGSKGHYYMVRDNWKLVRETKRLNKFARKSEDFRKPLSYDKSVKLVSCLSEISEVAAARPRNWQKYSSKHVDLLKNLLSWIFSFGEEAVIQTLKLLMLVFYTGKEVGPLSSKSHALPDGNEGVAASNSNKTGSHSGDLKKKRSGGEEGSSLSTATEKSFMDMAQAVDQLSADGGKVLRNFIDYFLLEWNAASVRYEAKAVLHGAWNHGKQNFRSLMLGSLLEKITVLPSYGSNIVEYTDLLTWLLGKGVPDASVNNQEASVVQSCLTEEVVARIFGALCAQNELLANHPNSRIYTTLASLVEFDGYYLESEPCLACSSPEIPYTRMKLDNLKSETKFTDNRILVKCVGSHTIQSVTMNVHDARRSKSVKVLNLYYNNRAVADLSELKNNWSLWKRARSCHLAVNQTELKVDFSIPITACNFMIELDSFYENLQASSLESLQCPRCSRYVTDKHGICSNCHENAYQCRQCRNINYENLDSFLCNECGYSKYGRFEFSFMAKPSFTFDSMENDDDMKKGLLAIEAESENAHRRYQQLLQFKKPLLKLVSSIGETEMDSQQKDSVQQMIVSVPGSSSFKINRKIAILGVLYGEKCKMAFDSVSKSVQTLEGLRRVLMAYLERKRSVRQTSSAHPVAPRPCNRCFGCANTFVAQCLEWLQVLAKQPQWRKQLVAAGILRELFENNIHQGPKVTRIQATTVLCSFTEGDAAAVADLNDMIKQKTLYCLEHHRSMDVAACIRDELQLLSETCSLTDEFWESRLRLVFQLLFRAIQAGARHPVIAEHIILPCLRIVSHACTPPRSETSRAEPTASPPVQRRSDSQKRVDPQGSPDVPQRPDVRVAGSAKHSPVQGSFTSTNGKLQSTPVEKEAEPEGRGQDTPLVNYIEWRNGATYVDFVRRQYITSQLTRSVAPKVKKDPKRGDFLALKYLLKWKRRAYKGSVTDELAAFEESSWVHELVLSPCSQAIRLEMCALIGVLCAQSPVRRAKFLNLLMNLLASTRAAGESAAEYFDLLFKMVEPEDSRLFLTVRGFLRTACALITEEVSRIEAQEWSVHTDISQGYILHKLVELLSKFLQVPNIRTRFMKENLLAQILEALLALRGLVVQKTKLTGDCGRLLRELLDGLLEESYENKRHFIHACIVGLQSHSLEKKDRSSVFILEQLCDIICPTKPEQAYMMVLNKAHTQEEFIRGSMTKNPYSSLEVGPLMRDVKNKICQQLELLGLLEDDYGMELLVAGNIIALDLSVAQVYEQVWRKSHSQAAASAVPASILAAAGAAASKECPPMTVTYRLQGLDGEATEPMIKELEEDREESQDPEVEFAIAGVMRECGGLEIVLNMVQNLSNLEMKAGQEELNLVLKLLMFCCKIRANRQALLQLGALGVLLEAARRAFSTDAAEPAEGLLLIVESLVSEANESDLGVSESFASSSKTGDGTGVRAANAVHMFLEKLSHPTAVSKSNKQQRNKDTVARILPYLTYGEESAMNVLIDHFLPYLKDWGAFDRLIKQHLENPKDEMLAHQTARHQLALDNFVKLTESIKLNLNGEKLKSLIMERSITAGSIRYLKGVFSIFEKGSDYRSSPEWAQGLEMPSVPIILSMLRGLSRGHLVTQECLDKEGILPLLHALEGVSGENEIGAKAENLLDTLADKESKGEGYLVNKVSTLRDATRDEMRRRALQKREELLMGLGMRRERTADGGERIVVAQPHIEGLAEVEEEEAGLACMVCREGYRLRPTDMLGAYCYSKRMNLAVGISSHVRAEWVYSTVSHFNVIHFQCHQEAKRADASLKNPKKEWEGATLRNSETLCNNLFPLRGPAVPLAHYARCVDQYWDNLNALGRADGSRLRLLTYDIAMMLSRFATSSSFSVDSKGGGRESNSRLLPFMVQMARHLVDQGGASQRRVQTKALATYLAPPSATETHELGFKPGTPPTPTRGGTTDDSVQFMMVQSVLLQSLEDWRHHRRTFLQRAVLHGFVQYKNGRSLLPASSLPSPLTSARNTLDFSNLGAPESKRSEELRHGDEMKKVLTGEQLFTVVQPMLVYVGLIDQMQLFLKSGSTKTREPVDKEDRKTSNSESVKDEGSVLSGVEPWETTMKDRLRDVSAMLGFAKDLLEWLEEMQGSQDIQEAFDVAQILEDGLSRHTSCEDFVRDAIASSQFR
ncbi:hypothetical protein R1flu_009177 [Riccia fluitans]|uniref:Auxin transport protein BIG n=1 Tax=Riccia fluitans TaxID=41844 RepID=A0ABD1Z1K3_9MARC